MELQLPGPKPINNLPPHKNWFVRHLLVEILSVALLVAAGAGAYYYKVSYTKVDTTPPAHHSQNFMADWKTYTNTKYGFELKYPNDITIQEKKSNISQDLKSDDEVTFSQGKNFQDGFNYGFDIDVNPQAFGIENCDKPSEKELTVNDIKMKRSECGGIITYEFSELKNNYLALLNSDFYDVKIFDQIISTFKFSNFSSAEAELGVSGGSIETPNHKATVKILPGSLSRKTKITVISYNSDTIPGVSPFMKVYGNVSIVDPELDSENNPASTNNYEQSISIVLEQPVTGKLLLLKPNPDGDGFQVTETTVSIDSSGKIANFNTHEVGTLILMKPEDLGRAN